VKAQLIMNTKLLAFLSLVIVTIGCSTTPVITKIESDPPGVKIEINEEFVGTTPIQFTLPQSPNGHKLKEMVVIRALPTEPGQYLQEKRFWRRNVVPVRVQFDMRHQSAGYQVIEPSRDKEKK